MNKKEIILQLTSKLLGGEAKYKKLESLYKACNDGYRILEKENISLKKQLDSLPISRTEQGKDDMVLPTAIDVNGEEIKVGDYVKVLGKWDNRLRKTFNHFPRWLSDMDKYIGNVYLIDNVSEIGNFCLGGYWFHPSVLQKVSKPD